MLQVRRTKYPSMRQMEKMTKNLKEKLGSGVIFANLYACEKPYVSHTNYWLSAPHYGKYIDTWEELQSEYRELMKGD